MSYPKRIKIIGQGRFPKHSVKCTFDNHERELPDASKRVIESSWNIFQRSHAVAYDEELFDVLDFRVSENAIRIIVGVTSYRMFVGTRSRPFVKSFGGASVPNPLAVRVLTQTKDGKLVFGLRSRWVQTNANKFDAPAGFVDRSKDWSDHCPDPYKAAVRELEEELQVDPKVISDLICIGAIHDSRYEETVLTFECWLDVDTTLLKPKTSEFEEIHFVSSANDSVLSFLRAKGRLIAPHCRESLALWINADDRVHEDC